jgi:hypothetical protein
MRTTTIAWLAVFALLVAGFGATVAALNASLYSAHGFVRTYLEALERKDATAALAIPGVDATTEGADALLTSNAMGDLGAISLVRDTEESSGAHTVVFDVVLDGEPARTEFHVERSGTRFGLYPTWTFAASPLATLAVAVRHADGFTVNGAEVASDDAFLVFAPGSYVVDHATTYLEADAATVAVTEPGTIVDAKVTAEPTANFVKAVQSEVNDFLDACVTQKVLQPTGCPFGRTINNRVEGDPTWSVGDYPTVSIVAGRDSGSWLVPSAPGVAHLTATVVSLFDGTRTHLDEDIEFTVAYVITLDGDRLSIAAA